MRNALGNLAGRARGLINRLRGRGSGRSGGGPGSDRAR